MVPLRPILDAGLIQRKKNGSRSAAIELIGVLADEMEEKRITDEISAYFVPLFREIVKNPDKAVHLLGLTRKRGNQSTSEDDFRIALDIHTLRADCLTVDEACQAVKELPQYRSNARIELLDIESLRQIYYDHKSDIEEAIDAKWE